MNQRDMEVNKLIMREIGLEVDCNYRIIDQDTGVGIRIGGNSVTAPGVYGGPNTIEFDPYNNKRLMNQFFGYFLDKHAEESDISVMTYYGVNGTQKNKSSIECQMSDTSKIRSAEYGRESLKYADIIMKLNGDESPDLAKYDVPPEKRTVAVKKGSRINVGRKSNPKTTEDSQ